MHGLAAQDDTDDLHPYEPESLTELADEFGTDFDFRMGTDQLPHARFKDDGTELRGEDFLDLRDRIIVFYRTRQIASPSRRVFLST